MTIKWNNEPFGVEIKDMDEKDKAKAPDLKGEDYSGKRFGYKMPDGYEFDTVCNGKIILKPIKPQYPKTYNECYNILNDFNFTDVERYDFENDWRLTIKDKNYGNILNAFSKLLICRDAYWKIAGEQMVLDKSWKPDWDDEIEIYYTISYDGVNIKCYNDTDVYSKLAFPTKEMRDAFYENFKDLIEKCKELL